MGPDTDLDTTLPDAGNEELSLRDQLEEAFEQEPTDEVRADDRPRDEMGRFAPKASEAPESPQERPKAEPQEQGAPQVPQAVQPAVPELKAPQSWRPDVREKWSQVDPDIKQEIHRREREHEHFMEQAAGARQFIDAFERTVRPFEVFIRAENSDPLTAVQSLFQTAATLRVGTAEQKAGLIAGIIQQHDVNIDLLDAVILRSRGHNVALPPAQQPQQFRDPRLDQLLAQQQQMLQLADQRDTQELHGMLSQFASDPQHEFFNDVRLVMADLIEMAGRRGQVLTVDEAYRRACQLDEGVSKILSQRSAHQSTGTLTQAALRAKRAAARVRGDTTLPDGATVPKGDSIRAALEAAMESHSRV